MNQSPVLDLLHKRRATRAIRTDPLPDDVIGRLVGAVRLTPSCANNQPWRFLFIRTEQDRAKASEAFTGGNLAWAPRAPLIVVGSANRDNDCKHDDGVTYHLFDTGMAVMNLMLEATALGLVARPMAGWKPELLREQFEFAADDDLVVMLAIGYPGDDESHVPDKYKRIEEKPRTRKRADEIVRHL
ncbi:MAG: 5,6-dimethylbenzimidazole synthase [Calditrichaeota bacterium]|nr:5,6-dimethylbenzimidazole synthase [Calditrichota bacterium]